MTGIILRAMCALVLLAASAAWAQNNESELRAAQQAAEQARVDGPATIELSDQARLNLPAGQVFVPREAAARLLASMGNRVDQRLLGAVFPADGAGWFAVLRFIADGYVRDDDAKAWSADALLHSLREGTAASNEERTDRGLPAIEVVGWAEPPRYEAGSHQLVWSASTRRQGEAAETAGLGVNYNTYKLGREGYISLNLVTRLDRLERHRPAALALLAATDYRDGKRYADFDGRNDKVAAYGLATLVAGGGTGQPGPFAFFARLAVVILLAVAALVWVLLKLRRRQAATLPLPLVGEPKSPA